MKKVMTKLALIGMVTLPAAAFAGHHLENGKQTIEQRAISALAKHLSIEENSGARVLNKLEKNWPDTSLGCPRVGLNYPQMIVPGFLVTLSKGDKSYNVHLSDKRAVVCTNAAQQPSKTLVKNKPKKLKVLQIEKLTNDSKADLASLLGVNSSDIRVVSTNPYNWPDSSLGCPEHGMNYAKAIVKGYRIVFETRNREYSYHTDSDQRFVPCPKIETQ